MLEHIGVFNLYDKQVYNFVTIDGPLGYTMVMNKEFKSVVPLLCGACKKPIRAMSRNLKCVECHNSTNKLEYIYSDSRNINAILDQYI